MPRKPSVYSTDKQWKATTFESARRGHSPSKRKAARSVAPAHLRNEPLKFGATVCSLSRLIVDFGMRRRNRFVAFATGIFEMFAIQDANNAAAISDDFPFLKR